MESKSVLVLPANSSLHDKTRKAAAAIEFAAFCQPRAGQKRFSRSRNPEQKIMEKDNCAIIKAGSNFQSADCHWC